MTEVASSVVDEVLGRRAHDVDQPIIDYVINVLADEDFDFGVDGEGVFEALGELLADSGWVPDHSECRSVCHKISEKFGEHGLVKAKPTGFAARVPFMLLQETELEKFESSNEIKSLVSKTQKF